MRRRRLELDYVARPRLRRWPGVALLAVSLALAGDLAWRYNAAHDELSRLHAERDLLPPASRPSRSQPAERLEYQEKNAQSVVRQLTLPWAPLIGVLEQASTADVALLALQPDAEQRLLRLTAEARDREAMFEYVRRLSSAGRLGEVHIVSHHIRQDDTGRPIQFSVQAVLR